MSAAASSPRRGLHHAGLRSCTSTLSIELMTMLAISICTPEHHAVQLHVLSNHGCCRAVAGRHLARKGLRLETDHAAVRPGANGKRQGMVPAWASSGVAVVAEQQLCQYKCTSCACVPAAHPIFPPTSTTTLQQATQCAVRHPRQGLKPGRAGMGGGCHLCHTCRALRRRRADPGATPHTACPEQCNAVQTHTQTPLMVPMIHRPDKCAG